MQSVCPSCDTSLPDGYSPFCGNCGAPLLRVQDSSVITEEQERPSFPSQTVTRGTGVDWHFALRCSVIVAVTAALLQLLSGKWEAAGAALTLWVLSAAPLTVILYHRGRPAQPMSARVGARMGAATGLLVASLVMLAAGGTEFALRYKFGVNTSDAQIAAVLDQAKAQGKLTTQMETYARTPEFRAGLLLFVTAVGGAFVMALNAVSGAAAGAMLNPRRRESRS